MIIRWLSRAADTAKAAQLMKEIEAGEKEMTQMQKDFVKNNPASFAAPSDSVRTYL